MNTIVVAIPHSHTWFWTQTCLASLLRNPPRAHGYDVRIVVVDNSPWSPAIRGLTETSLGQPDLWEMATGCEDSFQIIPNHKTNKFHASALDCVVSRFSFDYLMALETDVLLLRPDWLQWFVDQMRTDDFAVGMWHHEQFINPSCTLYKGSTLREMLRWCRGKSYISDGRGNMVSMVPDDELRWGANFEKTAPLDNNLPANENPAQVLEDIKGWIAGPFAEKRGFSENTILREAPSGKDKGPGWYEPGQQLHAWAVQTHHTYTVCPSMTTKREDNLPLQTLYGSTMPDPLRQLEAVELFGNAYAAHMWGGTRALDILKHPVTCQFVKANTPMWLAREARYWREVVPTDVQRRTLELIKLYGWHITGQGSPTVSDRDREAAEYVRGCYKEGGVEW